MDVALPMKGQELFFGSGAGFQIQAVVEMQQAVRLHKIMSEFEP
jgi:hypothetical protein